ncbi:hypothetical protein HOLleu_44409 [Holothuria leucospilota]|uniref:Uncharacterized protein n=1 Tax=Holothuria leucospilota TaxID=206669 RepID=A0A9Q0YDC7_HOLLE|nr:hypothetical protein HOLleu_44409 [Holothuria leucospilota]
MGAGLAVVAAGSAIHFGFDLEKFSKDQEGVRLVKPALEDYIAFNKSFLKAVLQLFASVGIIEDLKTWKHLPENETFTYVKAKAKTALQEFCKTYSNAERANEKLKCITEYSGFLLEHLILLIKKVTQEECSDAKLDRWNVEVFKKIKACDLEILPDVASGASEYISHVDLTEQTFARFVCSMFRRGDLPDHLDACGNLKEKRIGQDGTTIGTEIARVARGISAAGIILSSFGVDTDLTFIEHSVYSLVKNNQEALLQIVWQLANVMKKINTNLQAQL